MFYKTGVDITNDKQMFNFLKQHSEYWTANSWNGLKSIANCVKLYKLGLSGDWGVAYDLLASGEYDTINYMIQEWKREHRGYDVTFNGRSGGYLVLGNSDNNGHILPYVIEQADTYEEYKEYCRMYYGSVKAYRTVLVSFTKLVQSFDKLCDELRDFCDELSRQTFEILEMQKAVEQFNNDYYADLEFLSFSELRCDMYGSVYIGEIFKLQCLAEAFMRISDRTDCGYKLSFTEDLNVRMVKV